MAGRTRCRKTRAPANRRSDDRHRTCAAAKLQPPRRYRKSVVPRQPAQHVAAVLASPASPSREQLLGTSCGKADPVPEAQASLRPKTPCSLGPHSRWRAARVDHVWVSRRSPRTGHRSPCSGGAQAMTGGSELVVSCQAMRVLRVANRWSLRACIRGTDRIIVPWRERMPYSEIVLGGFEPMP